MAMEWGDLLNTLAQNRVVQLAQPAVASAPVTADPASGKLYVEGQPATGLAGFMETLKNNKVMLIGGVLVLAVGGYFLMRKK